MTHFEPDTDTLRTREPFSLRRLLATPIYVFPWSRGKKRWQEIVGESGLPRPVAQHVADVVRFSRLWRREKAEVARELCAHFADGLASGRGEKELISSFGDARAAAKLIQRAQMRKRPAWWRTWRFVRNSIAAAFVLTVCVYGVLAAMFYLASPKVSRNFLAEFNAPIIASPVEDRAWPVYIEAMRKMGTVPDELQRVLKDADGNVLRDENGQELDSWPQKPGNPRWPQAVAWMESRQDAFALIRAAAAKPILGCRLSNQTPREYEVMTAERLGQKPKPEQPEDDNPDLIGVLMPYLGEFRGMTRALRADARRAVELGDAERFVADTRAMLGIARHCVEFPTLIGKLVQIAILHVACESVQEALPSGHLKADHLRTLAHEFSTFDDSVLRAPLAAERSFLDDFVQRTYSDDGGGDGHITAKGFRLMGAYGGPTADFNDPDAPLAKVMGPLAVPVMASRKDLLSEADRLYALAEQQSARPLWNRDGSAYAAEMDKIDAGFITQARYRPLTLLLPAFDKAFVSCELAKQRRDAMLAALALESFRIQNGAYPSSLAQLVPAMLPRMPVDRYDGQPLKYTLIGDGSDAKPILYSIGVDRTDDGGMLTPRRGNEAQTWAYKDPAFIQSIAGDPQAMLFYQGDWILYDPAKAARRMPDNPEVQPPGTLRRGQPRR